MPRSGILLTLRIRIHGFEGIDRILNGLDFSFQVSDFVVQCEKLLGEIYEWFIEGFDTKDLKETKALL